MTTPIKVGIVDDHPGVRTGIRNLLASSKDIVVVGEGENGADAIQLVEQKKPDILLLDVELPVFRGDIVMQRLKDSGQNVKVLAISSYNDPIYVQGMLENGASGYITKEEAPRYLIDAIRSIIVDHILWISPFVVKELSSVKLDTIDLTGRELDILRHIVLGNSDDEIRQELKLGESEIKRYLRFLMKKFGVATRVELRNAAECIISTSAA